MLGYVASPIPLLFISQSMQLCTLQVVSPERLSRTRKIFLVIQFYLLFLIVTHKQELIDVDIKHNHLPRQRV